LKRLLEREIKSPPGRGAAFLLSNKRIINFAERRIIII
jgi:hypothetical protein